MAGPWEKYQQPKTADGPWSKYQQSSNEIPSRVDAGRLAGVALESAAPYLAASAGGAAVAGPFGAAMGPLALGLSDLAATGVNVGSQALGSDFRVPAPSNIMRQGFKAVAPSAFVTPETPLERSISTGTEAGIAALSQANALRMLAGKVAPGTVRNILAETGKAPGVQVAAAVPAAVTTQAVNDLADENAILEDPFARLMVGTAAGLLAGATGAKIAGVGAVKAPSTAALRAEAKAIYNAVDQSGVQFDPLGYEAWLSGVRGKLKSFDPAQHGAVELEIKNLEKSIGQSPTIGQLDAARSNIKKRLGKSTDPNIRRLGSELADEVDDFVMNSPVAATGGNYQQATQDLARARELYAALSKSDAMEELVRRAKLRSTPLDTAIRAEFANFARNPRKMRLLTPEERQFVEDVALTGKLARALTTVSEGLRVSRTLGGGLYAGAAGAGAGFLAPHVTPTQALALGATVLGTRAATGAAANALARRRASLAAAQMRGGRASGSIFAPVAAGTAAGLGATTPEELDFMREQYRISELGY